MTEIDRPWIRKRDQEWTPALADPEGLYSDENINKCLRLMFREAHELGLDKGVAFVAVWPFFSTNAHIAVTVVGKLERDPYTDKEGDLGTNYFGIAMSKLAYMLSTHEDSGSGARPLKNGEVEYRGGLIITTKAGTSMYFGFSGGTEEQDVQIAQKGLATLVQEVDG